MSRNLFELDGDFTMSGTRRLQGPGNFRAGSATSGARGDIASDEKSAEESKAQDAASLPQAVAVYVENPQGKILAVTRNIETMGPNPTNLNMPGGMVDPGETAEDAAARELFEETGIIAHKLVPIYAEVSGGKYVTAFKAVSWSGDVKSSWEGEASWQEPPALLKSTFGSFFRKVLNMLKK